MTGLRNLLLLIGPLVNAPVAAAAIQPSFDPDHCTWEATHVVVVTEGDKIDGVVQVLEFWKGDLMAGDRITVPGLAAFAPEETRTISKGHFRNGDTLPKAVTGSRMVLFLIRKQEKPEGGRPDRVTWLPADGLWKEVRVSAAWVEADRVYAFAQQINPGPSELIAWGASECEFKCRVDDVLAAQATLADAIRADDAEKRVAVVKPLLGSDSEYVRHAAIRTLGAAGVKSLPALRTILTDEALLKYHSNAIRAMARAGGTAVGPELTKVLEQELGFWKKVGPGLKKGWWNDPGPGWDEVERLRHHYSRAHAAVGALEKLRPAGCREAVVALRDFWRSLPQLAEIDQLDQACDDVLKQLPPPTPAGDGPR